MSKSGALFDLVMLIDISKNYISTLSAEEVYDDATDWALNNDKDLYRLLTDDENYAKAIFAIERGNAKPRKDIAKWDEVKDYIAYFYDELWDKKRDFPDNLSNEDMIRILETYEKLYNHDAPAEDWFPTVRAMAESMGYAKTPKLYKKTPELYKGHVGDVAGVIRVAVTGRRNTPDLYEIMQTLGNDEVKKRIAEAIELLN